MKHGTITGYKKHKCPCDDCRDANRRYMAKWRQQRRCRRANGAPMHPCWFCSASFPTEHGRVTHEGLAHP